jgi:hypothetical protein
LFRGGDEPAFGATDDRHGGAIRSKPPGARQAEATAAPGYQRVAPFEPATHCPIVA